jgi:hypothetical protein
MQYLPEESTRSFSTAETKKRRMKRQQLSFTDFKNLPLFTVVKFAAVNANIFMDFKVKSQFCNCLSFLLSFSNVTYLTSPTKPNLIKPIPTKHNLIKPNLIKPDQA